jgi:ribose 5-phosphate isomerase B
MIVIGSDHAGFELKESIKAFLLEQNISFSDIGTYSTQSCDYPDIAHELALIVVRNEAERGILICGSGEGVCITANKHESIRAALVWNVEIAKLSRQHNDANVLCLPARFLSESDANTIVQTFIQTAFEGGRHQKRIDKINI